jgi:hypothetical protein
MMLLARRLATCSNGDEWHGFEATVRMGDDEIHVVVDNPDRVSRGIRRLTVDGVELASSRVRFDEHAGSKHEVRIVLGHVAKRRVSADRTPIASGERSSAGGSATVERDERNV